jgi:hypothetical protein
MNLTTDDLLREYGLVVLEYRIAQRRITELEAQIRAMDSKQNDDNAQVKTTKVTR